MHRSFRLFATCLCLLALKALADAPNRVNVQGVLRDDKGALREGTFTLRFQIFPTDSSTTAILDESYNSVAVTSGVFAVQVGGSTPNLAAALAGAANPQIQVSVNGNALPKQSLSSNLYALHAQSVPFTGIIGTPAACPAGQFLSSPTGTCVALNAGAGLTATPAAGSVTLSVAFAGSGSANTAARSDHSHGLSCGTRDGTSGLSSNATCQSGETIISGGCIVSSGSLQSSYGFEDCGLIFCRCLGSRCFFNTWHCDATSGGSVTAQAICCASPIQ